MDTQIIKINRQKPEKSKVQVAANIIKNGGLVAFPTETVYGLGADVFNKTALKKIFQVKGRPFNDPLIVHIAEKKDLKDLAKNVPEKAEKLINAFWPGPLTIILKKSKKIPSIVTANLKTVAIRMPENKIALKLIEASNTPIAAPSANSFARPSPTQAKHVWNDLNQKIPVIIDGGQTKIGLESTIIDLTTACPVILRPGKITQEQIEKIIGAVKEPSKQNRKIKAPGMGYKHYSPDAKVILATVNKNKVKELIIEEKLYGKKVAVIGLNNFIADKSYQAKDINDFGKNLFKKFREFDRQKIDTIIVEAVNEKDFGTAIMNRVRRAAAKIITEN